MYQNNEFLNSRSCLTGYYNVALNETIEIEFKHYELSIFSRKSKTKYKLTNTYFCTNVGFFLLYFHLLNGKVVTCLFKEHFCTK